MKLRGIFEVSEFTNPAGSQSWRVSGTKLDGTRIRKNFANELEALGEKQRLEIEAKNGDTSAAARFTRLTVGQLSDAETALSILNGRYGTVTLTTAVNYFNENYRDPVTAKLFAEAAAEFIADKTAEGCRPDALRNLNGRLGWLNRRMSGKNVGDFSAAVIRAFLMRSGVSNRTRINDRAAWNNFFGWAKDKGYCLDNPTAAIKRKQFKTEGGEPEILSLADVKKLLQIAYELKNGVCFPFVALSLFAGMRPDKELSRIDWDSIDLKQKIIRVGGKVAKTRGRRVIELSDNLAKMLKPFVGKPIKHANWVKDFSRVRQAAGFQGRSMTLKKGETQDDLRPWPEDVMRHTAISNHFALHQHEGKTAAWAGNSPDVIHESYKGLVTPADAKAYWEINAETEMLSARTDHCTASGVCGGLISVAKIFCPFFVSINDTLRNSTGN